MRRLFLILLLTLISSNVFSESQSYFAYGYKLGLRNVTNHIYVFTDYEEGVLVVITDFDDNWRISEGEVYIYRTNPVGPPLDAIWTVENIRLEINGYRAKMWIDDVKIKLEWVDKVWASNY